MEYKYYALIQNNIVQSIIIADDSFLKHIENKYQYIIDVTDNKPTVGDSYYNKTNKFIPNNTDKNEISVDLNLKHLKNGTETEFKPFTLSKYSVRYEDGFVIIGCKKYSAAGLLDALHKVLIEKHHTTSHFTTFDDGPAHGKFGITWDDAKLLYDALNKVKLQ